MRKPVVLVLALVSVLLMGATAVSYSKYQQSQADFRKATADQETMRQRYDRAVEEIVTIQDSLNAIVLGDEALSRDIEREMPPTLGDKVLSRVATLKAAVERTKGRIEELDARVKRSGVKIRGMEQLIAGLKRSVHEKEERIAALTSTVDTLETRVTGLSAEVEGKEQVIVQQDQQLTEKQRELATVFYTMGTKKQLTRSGLVQPQGGLLGLGRTLRLSGTYNESVFTPLNTDQDNVIRIPAEKAENVQVLSAQPASSYAIQPVSKEMVELRILNPVEFRKIKHVVILTNT